ncbi:MAG: hypothetical protein SO314_02615, partial [Alphaproteobacteria bacterium]|nr:hypothetical protein [Alphaproteobacteria bacterium]
TVQTDTSPAGCAANVRPRLSEALHKTCAIRWQVTLGLFFIVIPGLDPGIHLTTGTLLISS